MMEEYKSGFDSSSYNQQLGPEDENQQELGPEDESLNEQQLHSEDRNEQQLGSQNANEQLNEVAPEDQEAAAAIAYVRDSVRVLQVGFPPPPPDINRRDLYNFFKSRAAYHWRS